jgi:SAM-dependent methyltransferase
MGYGRNAVWLAQQGYEVEGWELDRKYVAEANREARRQEVQGTCNPWRGRLTCQRVDFARAKFRGPYHVIVISNALHQVRRSAALRVLRRARRALARRGLLFLVAKLARDREFQRAWRNPAWRRVPGERNTLFRPRRQGAREYHPGRPRRRRMILSALTPADIKRTLRGLKPRHYAEAMLRSDWEEDEPVTHTVAEVVAERI